MLSGQYLDIDCDFDIPSPAVVHSVRIRNPDFHFSDQFSSANSTARVDRLLWHSQREHF